MEEKVNQEIAQAEAGSEEKGSIRPQKAQMKRLVKPLIFTLLAIVTAGGFFGEATCSPNSVNL